MFDYGCTSVETVACTLQNQPRQLGHEAAEIKFIKDFDIKNTEYQLH